MSKNHINLSLANISQMSYCCHSYYSNNISQLCQNINVTACLTFIVMFSRFSWIKYFIRSYRDNIIFYLLPSPLNAIKAITNIKFCLDKNVRHGPHKLVVNSYPRQSKDFLRR